MLAAYVPHRNQRLKSSKSSSLNGQPEDNANDTDDDHISDKDDTDDDHISDKDDDSDDEVDENGQKKHISSIGARDSNTLD